MSSRRWRRRRRKTRFRTCRSPSAAPRHTVDVEGYFSDSVNQYNVSASPSDIVHTSRSGTVITIEPLKIGTATVTVKGKKSRWQRAEAIHRHGERRWSPPPPLPAAFRQATIIVGATHAVTASDYFDGEGDHVRGGVLGHGGGDGRRRWRGCDGDGGRRRQRDRSRWTATNASGSAEQALRRHRRPASADVTVGSIEGVDAGRGRNPSSHRLGLLRAARRSRTRWRPRTRPSRRSPSMARW